MFGLSRKNGRHIFGSGRFFAHFSVRCPSRRTGDSSAQAATALPPNVQHKKRYWKIYRLPHLQEGAKPASSNGCAQYRVWTNQTACSLHYESFSGSKRVATQFRKAAFHATCGEGRLCASIACPMISIATPPSFASTWRLRRNINIPLHGTGLIS